MPSKRKKKMAQEKQKKTGGKRKVLASGKDKKAMKCSTYKWHFGQFWLCMARQWLLKAFSSKIPQREWFNKHLPSGALKSWLSNDI